MNNCRKISYDIIKLFGIFSAMLAHHNLNDTILNAISYSVPVLIFLSGLLSKTKIVNYRDFLRKRVKRIVIPTYVFISAVFLLRFIISLVFNNSFYSFYEIISTLLLSDNGLGYVWITRIFFLIAMVEPILININKRIKNDYLYLGAVAFFFIFAEILRSILIGYKGCILYQYSVYIFPYIGIYLVGKRCKTSKKFILLSTVVIFLVLPLLIMNYGFEPKNGKYPPRIDYVVYGLGISCIIYSLAVLCDRLTVNSKVRRYLAFFSDESFVIYLIQAFIIIFYTLIRRKISFSIWMPLEVIIITMISILGAFILNRMKRRLKKWYEKNNN